MKYIVAYTYTFVFWASIFLPMYAYAQNPADSAELTPPAPLGVSCFDYYTFGSVQVPVTVETKSAVSGTPIRFSATIENTNTYPIVDGTVFIKVFKMRGDTNDGNGPDVVDEFYAAHNVVVPAQGSVPLSFTWNVPAYAQTGEYRIATFFTTSRKFNLLGLSFTDDIIGNSVSFSVVGEQKEGVFFEKDTVTVQNEPYYFAAFPPRLSAQDPVAVEARVHNTTATLQRIPVVWTVYQWDAQLRENVVQEYTETIVVPARSTAPAKITVSDTKYPVYLARAELHFNDTKSIIGVRFVRDGVDRIRINFPGVISYPLAAGEQNTLFSCLHNSGTSDIVAEGELALTLSDKKGNVIHSYTYRGDVSGAMMGVADTFTPKQNYDYFVLDARLYQYGAFVDEAHLVYDCEKISGECAVYTEPSLWSSTQSFFDAHEDTRALIAGGVILLFVFGVLVVVYTRRR